MVCVQGVRSGSLLNTRLKPDGAEIKTEFKPGEAFVEGADAPHYIELLEKGRLSFW